MTRMWSERAGWITAWGLVIAIALALGGCGLSSNDAEAADEDNLVQTFFIQVDSFKLATVDAPDVQVADGATTYEVTSNGTLLFRLRSGGDMRFDLDGGETIIERPGAEAVTFIRDTD